MFNQVSLGLGAGLLTISILVIYFSQTSTSTFASKIYRRLLLTTLFCALFQFILAFILMNYGNYLFLSHLFMKLFWLITFYYFINLFIYLIAIGMNQKNLSLSIINKNKLVRYVYIFSGICLLAFIISPVNAFIEGGVINFSGITAIIPLIYSLVVSIIGFIYAYKHTIIHKAPYFRMTIYAIGVLIFNIIFQLLVPTLCTICFSMTCIIYILYFLNENPDLYIIDELSLLQKQVEDSKKSKTDVLANMSREIKKPIESITNNVQDILNNNLTIENNKKIISEITNDGNSLIETIDHILEISLIENGKDNLNETEYSIANIIFELEKNYKFKLQKKNLNLNINIAPNVPNKLYGDSNKIKRILNNLLSYSLQSTDYGRIQIDVKCDTAGNLTNLHIIISDTGIGIKNEYKENIFNPDDKGDNSASLGVAISKTYIEQMNGTIKLDSTYLAGTIFYLDLSQEVRDSTPVVLDEIDNSTTIEYTNYNKQRIVIVDEDALNRKVLIRLLENYNFDIDEAESGIDFLNKIKQGNVYDLILIDHQMAGIDGIEVLNALIKLKQFFEIPPVVMTTANATSGKRDFYLNNGFDEYIPKPITSKELNRVIKKLVKVKNERGYEINEMNFDDNSNASDSSVEVENYNKNNMEEIVVAPETPIQPEIVQAPQTENVTEAKKEAVTAPQVEADVTLENENHDDDDSPFVELTREEKMVMDESFPKNIVLHDLSANPDDDN